jgi:hypothetical protein
MVSEMLQAKWIGLLKEWLAILNPAPIDSNQEVWHYTRGESLIKMVEQGSLLMTQVSCLNDTSEIRHAIRLFRDALLEVMAETKAEESIYAFLQRYLGTLNDDDDVPANANNMFFVTCFSELRDDLGMWRSYSGGENGYAVGFKIGHLFAPQNNCLLGRVNYDLDTHRSLARQMALATVDAYKDWRNELGEARALAEEMTFLTEWSSAITHVAPFVKDAGFSSEKEIRITRPFVAQDFDRIIILQKKTMMTRHLPLQFPAGLVKDAEKFILPISQLIVGPGRHKQVSLVSVHTLLAKYKYPSNLGVKSVRPYQET